MNKKQLPHIITQHFVQLSELCSHFGVHKLYAFGSVLTKQFNINSDLDFVVELRDMPPLIRGETLISLWTELEELFSRKVDLLTEESIRNPYLQASIDRNKYLIYDRESEEILS